MSSTVADIRRAIIGRLTPVVGDGEARAMAAVILEDVLGIREVEIALHPERDVTDQSHAKIAAIVDRVVAGEPLQYVIGSTLFHGLRLAVKPGVLIPRPETSQLVDIVADAAGDVSDLRVLDVCTGSGAIAASLGRTLRFPTLTAVDISDDALAVATANFNALGLKVDLTRRDVLKDGLPAGPFDIIVSNPPYVDDSERADIDPRVLDHEPAIALFVPDSDPLLFYRHIAADAMRSLVQGGRLYFEINPRHADDMVRLLNSLGYENVSVIRDFTGRNRFTSCQKPSSK